MLNVVTGNLDREGGVMFPSPAIDLMTSAVNTLVETVHNGSSMAIIGR